MWEINWFPLSYDLGYFCSTPHKRTYSTPGTRLCSNSTIKIFEWAHPRKKDKHIKKIPQKWEFPPFFLKRRFFFKIRLCQFSCILLCHRVRKLVNPYSSPWAMAFLTDQRTTRQIRLITSFALANQKIHFLVFLI